MKENVFNFLFRFGDKLTDLFPKQKYFLKLKNRVVFVWGKSSLSWKLFLYWQQFPSQTREKQSRTDRGVFAAGVFIRAVFEDIFMRSSSLKSELIVETIWQYIITEIYSFNFVSFYASVFFFFVVVVVLSSGRPRMKILNSWSYESIKRISS